MCRSRRRSARTPRRRSAPPGRGRASCPARTMPSRSSARSPCWCPRSSLKRLKPSMSRITTPSGAPVRTDRASSRLNASSSARRFAKPVSGSVWAAESSRLMTLAHVPADAAHDERHGHDRARRHRELQADVLGLGLRSVSAGRVDDDRKSSRGSGSAVAPGTAPPRPGPTPGTSRKRRNRPGRRSR